MKNSKTHHRQSIKDAALIGDMKAKKEHIREGRMHSWDLFKSVIDIDDEVMTILDQCIELDTNLIDDLLDRL